MRGDSSWRIWLEEGGTDITEFVEIITENLLREFGDAEPENNDDEALDAEDEQPYPAIDLRGGGLIPALAGWPGPGPLRRSSRRVDPRPRGVAPTRAPERRPTRG